MSIFKDRKLSEGLRDFLAELLKEEREKGYGEGMSTGLTRHNVALDVYRGKLKKDLQQFYSEELGTWDYDGVAVYMLDLISEF
jgi:hypothetical protein